MPRYFFNVYNDIDTLDQDGQVLADLAAAREVAVDGARALMAEHVARGIAIKLHHRIEVADDSGKVVLILPFRDAITFLD